MIVNQIFQPQTLTIGWTILQDKASGAITFHDTHGLEVLFARSQEPRNHVAVNIVNTALFIDVAQLIADTHGLELKPLANDDRHISFVFIPRA